MAHAQWGMVNDPLAEDLSAQPSLELASVPVPGRKSRPRQAKVEEGGEANQEAEAKPKRPSRAQRRRSKILEIAGYGPRPTSVLYVVPYFVRVFLRRRVVAEELAELAVARKKAESQLADALGEVGGALYVRRADPRLAALGRHAAIVTEAERQVDAGHKHSQLAQQDASSAMSEIARRLEAAQNAAAPVRERGIKLQAKLHQLEQHVAALAQTVQSCEQRIARIQSKKVAEPQDVEVLQGLHAERAEAHGHVQSTQLTMHPIKEELQTVLVKVKKHQQIIAELEAEAERHGKIMERDQARHARQAGDARNALQTALQSLARAAIEQGFGRAVPRLVEAVERREKDVARKREREAVHREALSSYDESAYRRGMLGLVGGTGAVFLTTVLLIAL